MSKRSRKTKASAQPCDRLPWPPLAQQPIARRTFFVRSSAALGTMALGNAGTGSARWSSTFGHDLDARRSQEPNVSVSNHDHTRRGFKHAVATVHPLATQAAAQVFGQGGNAIDAAIAASFMLSVVDGYNSGIGGGCFILVRSADGKTTTIDGRETAPAAATSDMFVRDGKPNPKLSQTGPLAVAIPGQVAAMELLWKQLGTQSWASLVGPAAATAEAGFPLGALANVIRQNAKALSQFADTKRVLLPGQTLPKPEDLFRQVDLSATLTSIAEQGADGFYHGQIAQSIADFLQSQGGIATAADFANYRAKVRQPVVSQYRDFQVYGFPPPSSGGIHVAQMLGMLQHFDVAQIFRDAPVTGHHLLLEVMKRAMADRAFWLGDADYAQVPAGLIDPGYLKSLADSIDLQRALPVAQHGMPPGSESQFFGDKHTTHLTTADAAGNVVAITQTINTTFGCKMIAGKTGIVLNNQMDDFSIAPGVRNAFGLVGAEANAIAPGKRPLSSMSPTLVLDSQGRAAVTCGAAGGPKIITATLQNIVRVLDLQQSIDQAIASPRLHHQWSPDQAVCEEAMSEDLRSGLRSQGHQVTTVSSAAVAQGIQFQRAQDNDPAVDEVALIAAADPRANGIAWAQ